MTSRATTLEQRRNLLWGLVVRDIRVRYRRSVLGILWSQIAPLSMLVVLSVLFTQVVPLGIDNYPVFAFTGLLAWQWFQASITSATTSVVEARDLVRRPGFPVRVLPVVSVASQLVHYLLGLPILVVAVIATTGRLPLTILALPFVVTVQFLVTVGPAYLLARMHVSLRDTAHLVAITLILFFYVTPVFYDAGRVLRSAFAPVYTFNPMARLVTAYRDVLLAGRWPDMRVLVALSLVGAVLAVIGIVEYDRASARFDEEL